MVPFDYDRTGCSPFRMNCIVLQAVFYVDLIRLFRQVGEAITQMGRAARSALSSRVDRSGP
jgi:hypothetical protein